MSQTSSEPYPSPSATATFNDDGYHSIVHQVQEDFLVVGVLGGLYGVLTVLSILSIHALAQRIRRKHPTAIVLCLAILILFASTTIYMVTTILFYLSQFLVNIIAIDLYSDGSNAKIIVPEYLVKDYSPLRACTSMATLTINVILGDAIVCWRACVVWQKKRVVTVLCSLFLLATSILGAVTTASGCGPDSVYASYDRKIGLPQGTMFEGFPIGIAACAVSLATNMFATALVGQKAWESRRRLKKYFAAGPRSSQVGKLFSLLIESGAVYCAIWSVVVAFFIRTYKLSTWLSLNPTGSVYKFLYVFGIFLNSAFVPVIAIYPTLIIVIVALNRSHIERGITQHMESLPTPRITATINTTTIASLRTEGRAAFGSRVLVIDDRTSEYGDHSEDDSTHAPAGEELKVERIV